jgi:hypothetical protein
MTSNWKITQQRSKYHFDTSIMDPKWDTVVELGHITPTWNTALADVIDRAGPVTWRSRGKPNDSLVRATEEYDQEEYDLESYGMSKDYVVTDLTYDVPAVFQDLADKFALESSMTRIHVQHPGQVWNLHLDKLEKWMPDDPSRVVRYFVQLTDWQMGHFWNYGNYTWSHWQAGNVSTFDWRNVPHSTANAGHVPRVTLQITGIETDNTKKFIAELATK